MKEDLEKSQNSEAIGFIIVDGNDTILGRVCGDRNEILFQLNKINLPRKHSKGGQSSVRFEEIRREKRLNFIKKVCEIVNKTFIYRNKDVIVSKLVLAGVANLKNELYKCDLIDYRLRKIIMKPFLTIPYGGKFGFYCAIKLSKEMIKDVQYLKEQELLDQFFQEIQKSMIGKHGNKSKICYGMHQTMKFLQLQMIDQLIVSSECKFLSPIANNESEDDGNSNLEGSVVDYLIEKYQRKELPGVNALKIVTTNTSQGHQFMSTFGGIAGLLKYPIDSNFIVSMQEDEDDELDELENSFSEDFIQSRKIFEESEFQKKQKKYLSTSTQNEGERVKGEEKGEKIQKKKKEKGFLNVQVIGHVDSGKSTICGQLIHQTGMIDERTIGKLKQDAASHKRESWYLAYLMDTSEEEKEKGKTVQVGRTYIETKSKKICLLDSPGHLNYISEMIENSFIGDLGILIVSAKDNEFKSGFQGGQTEEHSFISRTMGLKKIIVVVNKMDIIDWNQKKFEKIHQKMIKFLCNSLKFSKENVTIIPVSGMTGENIKENSTKNSNSNWYKGKSLMEAIDSIKIAGDDKKDSLPLRISIVDKYAEAGTKLQVSGKIIQGIVNLGDSVVVKGLNGFDVPCEVMKIASYGRKHKKIARSREFVELSLKLRTSFHAFSVTPGSIICAADKPKEILESSNELLAEVSVTKKDFLFLSDSDVIFHVHSSTVSSNCEIIARIEKNRKLVPKKTGEFRERLIVKIQLEKEIAFDTYFNSSTLGRFILRNEETTLAVGKVLKKF